MAANAQRLVELSMVPELAKEVASQMNTGTLQIGTTGTTAMAGNRTPTATIRGGVLQQATIADLAGGADAATIVTKVNALLAALEAAGVLASS